MSPTLPDNLAEKIYSFPESSYGTNRVTLVLGSGRKIKEVYLAWGRDIVKIGSRKVTTLSDLDFEVSEIVDVVSDI